MDESEHPTSPVPEPPTPEVAQLLKLIEMQTAAQRERRSALPKSFQGATFRYGSLVMIVVFGVGSIVFMEWFISQLPKPAQRNASTPGVIAAPSVRSGTSGPILGGRPQ